MWSLILFELSHQHLHVFSLAYIFYYMINMKSWQYSVLEYSSWHLNVTGTARYFLLICWGQYYPTNQIVYLKDCFKANYLITYDLLLYWNKLFYLLTCFFNQLSDYRSFKLLILLLHYWLKQMFTVNHKWIYTGVLECVAVCVYFTWQKTQSELLLWNSHLGKISNILN